MTLRETVTTPPAAPTTPTGPALPRMMWSCFLHDRSRLSRSRPRTSIHVRKSSISLEPVRM